MKATPPLPVGRIESGGGRDRLGDTGVILQWYLSFIWLSDATEWFAKITEGYCSHLHMTKTETESREAPYPKSHS